MIDRDHQELKPTKIRNFYNICTNLVEKVFFLSVCEFYNVRESILIFWGFQIPVHFKYNPLGPNIEVKTRRMCNVIRNKDRLLGNIKE